MISIIYTRDEINRWNNEVNNNMKLIEGLRKAGIPIVGNLGIQSVEHGELTIKPRANIVEFVWKKGAPTTVLDDL